MILCNPPSASSSFIFLYKKSFADTLTWHLTPEQPPCPPTCWCVGKILPPRYVRRVCLVLASSLYILKLF